MRSFSIRYSLGVKPVRHLRRRVHEVEGEQVVDPQRLEQQHGVGEVGALDLRHGSRQQLLAELPLRVQAERPPGTCTTRSTCALASVRLAHRVDLTEFESLKHPIELYYILYEWHPHLFLSFLSWTNLDQAKFLPKTLNCNKNCMKGRMTCCVNI